MSASIDSDELRVSPLELFFDLVFVFSITQVATLLEADTSIRGLVGGLLVLLLISSSFLGALDVANLSQSYA